MKIMLNILKAFLINFCLIGIIFAAESCPSISPKMVEDTPSVQVKAIFDDIVCSFIDLYSKSNGTLSSTLNLTKKKIIPYIDLEYSTQLALSSYWDQLDVRERKVFERDLKSSLIEDYISILASINNWENINVSVSDEYFENENTARVKLTLSLKNSSESASVVLKLVRRDMWKIYDLEYQSISIMSIEEIGYDSKIKRQGIDRVVDNLLKKP
jgi:phospholipid transport system substrate-binding protein